MDDWSDLQQSWKSVARDSTPDIEALAERVRQQGRRTDRYFRFQLIGSILVIPFGALAWLTVDSRSDALVMTAAIVVSALFLIGWWSWAWPSWREARATVPTANPRAIKASALRRIRHSRRLAAVEVGVALLLLGVAAVVAVHLHWTDRYDLHDTLILCAALIFALVWGRHHWKRFHSLRAEADAILGRR